MADQCRFLLIIDQVLKADISFCGFVSMNVFSGPKEGPVLQFGELVLKAGVLYCTVIAGGMSSMYLKPFPCKLFVIQRYQVLYTRNVDFIFGVSRKKNSATSSKSSVLDTLSNTVSKSPANRFCPAVHRAASQRRIQTLCLCFEINQRIFHLCYSTDHLIPVN